MLTAILPTPGQAMGGTLTVLASILDLAATKEVTDSALAYFLTADLFIVLCIVTYLLLPKLAYSRSVAKKTCALLFFLVLVFFLFFFFYN